MSASRALSVAANLVARRARNTALVQPFAAVSCRWSSNAASQFDLFQRLKDPATAAEAAEDPQKRKPSDRVTRLVDEIMNLTLIEAADLCDLCQEKLAARSGGPSFSGASAAGRTPFPHPAGMFAGMGAGGVPGMMPPMMPMMQQPMGMMPPMMGGMPQAAPAAPAAAAPAAEPAAAAPAADKKAEAKKDEKAQVSLKLVGFDAAKKVNVVKEVRAITALGLKESKELVEAAPKVVKKGIPMKEAEEFKKKLEAAGAEVVLE